MKTPCFIDLGRIPGAAAVILVALTLGPALPMEARADLVGTQMAEAAKQLLAVLDDEQNEKVTFDLKDEERTNWHYVPIARNGLSMKGMTSVQRQLTFALLSSGLSGRGVMQSVTIMTLEQILWELEGRKADGKRDPENYFVWIFGEPGKDATWGWRVEGHHLSVNFTLKDGVVVSGTPCFFATNPGRVKQGPRKGLQVLAREEYMARSLMKSLDDKQKAKALIGGEPPKDIFSKELPRVEPLDAVGLPVSKMNEEQKKKINQLMREYVTRHRPELARADLATIAKAGDENILFAWSGGVEWGDAHYYRVQGPTFLFEYANTQNDANHVHAVWRDFDGDFGVDVLAKHFRESHAAGVVAK